MISTQAVSEVLPFPLWERCARGDRVSPMPTDKLGGFPSLRREAHGTPTHHVSCVLFFDKWMAPCASIYAYGFFIILLKVRITKY
jgi:hypothetical protein